MSSTNQPPSANVSPTKLPLSQAEDTPKDLANYEVVIVGAGMAGLAAAYDILLKRPSTKLVVLESREDRVGGRIHSLPVIDGKTIDLGARYAWPIF